MVKLICWLFVIVVLRDSGVKLEPEQCDQSRRAAAKEGILGSVQAFRWLGVLRVHLHHETSLKIALTGIVLVKEKYAIGSADDLARIPKRVFKEDSRAMFIPAERAPWFCRPVDYMTHPEYGVDTLTSLALIELEPPPDTSFPMKPVCWPSYSYNTSSNLYAVGYTDGTIHWAGSHKVSSFASDNQLLEKFIYKVQYVEQDLCKEFYNRAGAHAVPPSLSIWSTLWVYHSAVTFVIMGNTYHQLSEGQMAPQHYQCAFASANKDSCVWDNGMALVSNTSGRWVLVGLGIQGPGCAAPARFLSFSHYYSWIESATDVQLIDEEDNYRRSAFNEGFKKSTNVVEYIPAHELLRSNSSHIDASKIGKGVHEKHDFSHYYPYDTLIHGEDPFQINRVSGTEIQIALAKYHPYRLGRYGNCSDKSIRVIYKDFINVTVTPYSNFSPPKKGIVHYKMSLYDSMFLNYTCVTIKLHVRKASPAYLYYDIVMDDGTLFPEEPVEVIQVYPFHKQTKLLEKGIHDHLVAAPIASEGKNFTVHNVNLYLKIHFQGQCRLEIRFFGPPVVVEPRTHSTSTTTTSTSTTIRTTTKDPYSDLRKNIPLEFVAPESEDRNIPYEENEPAYSNAPFIDINRGLFWFVAIFRLF